MNERMYKTIPSTLSIETVDDLLDIMANARYEGFNGLEIDQQSLPIAFFDLKTGLAGEMLQKFSNYRMQVTINGNFASMANKNLQDFIRECNSGNQIRFMEATNQASVSS